MQLPSPLGQDPSLPQPTGVNNLVYSASIIVTDQIRKRTTGGTFGLLAAGGTPIYTFDDATGLSQFQFGVFVAGTVSSPIFQVIGDGVADRFVVLNQPAGTGINIESTNAATNAVRPFTFNGSRFDFTTGVDGTTQFRVYGGAATSDRFLVTAFGPGNGIALTSTNTGEGVARPMNIAASRFLLPQDSGATQTVCALFAGTGVPNNANGNNGDYYLRGDTPGTAGQRLYVRSAGAWVATAV